MLINGKMKLIAFQLFQIKIMVEEKMIQKLMKLKKNKGERNGLSK
jgi:hypothetical protein